AVNRRQTFAKRLMGVLVVVKLGDDRAALDFPLRPMQNRRRLDRSDEATKVAAHSEGDFVEKSRPPLLEGSEDRLLERNAHVVGRAHFEPSLKTEPRLKIGLWLGTVRQNPLG